MTAALKFEQPPELAWTASAHSLYASRQLAAVVHVVVLLMVDMHVVGDVDELPTHVQNVTPHERKPRQFPPEA